MIYPNELKSCHLERAKTPGLQCRKRPCIDLILGRLRPCNRGNFRAAPNANFSAHLGIVRSRRYMSLIEIMIVMALLAILIGAVSISITQAIRQERYRAGVTQLVNRLQLAQDIMLIARGDVAVRLSMGKEGLECYFDVAQALLPLLQRFINRTNHAVIKGIGGFAWTPKSGRVVTDQPVWLNFKSGGTRTSPGELRLSLGPANPSSGLQSYILFSGIPQPLFANNTSRFNSLEHNANAESMLEKLYPIEVRELVTPIIQRIEQQEAQKPT